MPDPKKKNPAVGRDKPLPETNEKSWSTNGTFMSFPNGRVGRTTPYANFSGKDYVSYESMDTTGLAKGKENFVVTTSVNGQQTNKTINRKDVPAKIQEMKKGASSIKKF